MSLYTTNNKLKRILGTSKGSAISVGSITIFFVVLMIFTAIVPAYRSISDQIKNNEAKTTYYNDMIAKRNTLDKLSKLYEANSFKIEYFNSYANSNPNTELYVANLAKKAQDNGFTMTNITFVENSSNDKDLLFQSYAGIVPKKMNLAFEGKMANIPNIFNELEKFPMTMAIKSFTITQKKPTNLANVKQSYIENDTIQINYVCEFYFWNPTNK